MWDSYLNKLRKMKLLKKIIGDKKRVFISFCGFKPSEDEYIIKEFGIIILKNEPSVKVGLFKPPSDWEELTDEAKVSFIEMEMKHGIPWDSGVYDPKLQKNILKKYLDDAFMIYVNSFEDKENLLKVIGDSYKDRVMPITIIGYREGEIPANTCSNHADDMYACTYDIANQIYKWFVRRRMFHSIGTAKELRRELKKEQKN